METIMEHKYYDNLRGMDIVDITVGDFSTRIAKWKDNKYFQLSLNTTPRCWLIDTTRDFKSVENAKNHYLETLKILIEDTLELLKDIDYKNKR